MRLSTSQLKNGSKRAFVGMIASLAVFSAVRAQPASADVVRNDSSQIEGLSHRRVYEWKDTTIKPKAVAIAVHGLVLHGGVYDKMARELAAQGFVVVAPDLRGYGRWQKKRKTRATLDNATIVPLSGLSEEQGAEQQCSDCNSHKVHSSSSISYSKSYGDLQELTRAVRNQYPTLPLYVIGESLGAGFALHLAADMPDSIDGLILSSPAIKHRIFIEPRMVMDFTVMMLKPPKLEVDLVPYIKRFASEDPTIAEATIQDPLVRKKVPMFDLLATSRLIKGNIKLAEKVPENMPVLVIQGDRDRMLNSNGVVVLLDHLKSTDQTVKWFPGKGHILLETPHIQPETMETLSSWLSEHLSTRSRPSTLSSVTVPDDLD